MEIACDKIISTSACHQQEIYNLLVMASNIKNMYLGVLYQVTNKETRPRTLQPARYSGTLMSKYTAFRRRLVAATLAAFWKRMLNLFPRNGSRGIRLNPSFFRVGLANSKKEPWQPLFSSPPSDTALHVVRTKRVVPDSDLFPNVLSRIGEPSGKQASSVF